MKFTLDSAKKYRLNERDKMLLTRLGFSFVDGKRLDDIEIEIHNLEQLKELALMVEEELIINFKPSAWQGIRPVITIYNDWIE